LLVNTLLFLAMSVACAFAQNLSQMIALRAVQGFFGGTLIPLALTIALTFLPRSKQPMGLALFALSSTFAPAIGPTIGGYLTENYGWQYIFYINIVPGLIMVGTLWPTLPKSAMRLGLLREGDWVGMATMGLGLATLQTALEEGNKDDWFGSPFIVRLTIISAVSLTLFVWIELTSKQPLLDLRLLARRNFGLGSTTAFILGMALYGSTFLMPLYLSQTQGYNAEQVGMVWAWTGLPQLILIPLTPRLMGRIDARLLVVIGFGLFAASCFMNTAISPDYAGPQLFLPNVVRAIGQALVMTPLTSLSTAGIERASAASASAIFNMARNLGGAIGIAMLQTLLTKREQFHSSVLTARVSLTELATQSRIAALQSRFMRMGVGDPATAWHEAVVQIGRIVRLQSNLLAYSDAFYVMGAALLLAIVAVLMMRKASGGAAAGAH
jgi:DHA2 family multidrug resistance protein